MNRFQPFLKPALALSALLLAFFVTFVWPEHNGLSINLDGSPRARAAQDRDPYDLTQLQVLNRALLEVRNGYVDPDRINPRRMLLGGLNDIQRTIAPVLLEYEDDADEFTLQVNAERQTFPIHDVTSPWTLASRFREVFQFLQGNLDVNEDVDFQEIEYTAINGMLRTLDPHTVLLTPDVFEDMRMSTRGEFGGLGIVISLRDGHLTIIRPMPGTPATRAGLRRYDRIVKINEESTLNMPLSEAVDRLRGAPGSDLSVWVSSRGRGGNYGAPRRVRLTRAIIHIASVSHRMLDDGIGYIKILAFQGNTHSDMLAALHELHEQGLRGLVLDLRDNPGGLLEQAVRISDQFLETGTIVTTSSNDPRQREESFAHRPETEPDYPMVVLVNGASASASEIVAGALKAHNRAMIIGGRTFGKGSVQILSRFQDGSALKLTTAQYLTPGDVSIQGVGIVPDIAIDPMTVDPDDMDLEVDQNWTRESDLGSHLTHESARTTSRPSTVMRYYLATDVRQRLRESSPDEREENEMEGEFLTRFAQRILARASTSDREDLLRTSADTIEEVRRQELERAIAELRRLGIDWTEGEDAGPSPVDVTVTTSNSDNVAEAGSAFELRVQVTNRGENPLFRLRATTESDYTLFDNRELIFGRLNPGETREWSATLGVCETDDGERSCRIPESAYARADGIVVNFHEAHEHTPEPATIRTEVRALPRPLFAYQVHINDAGGDGRVERGERVNAILRVRNLGPGRTYETQANLRNLSGRGILLRAGRFHIDDMAPGDERVVPFTLDILEDFDEDEARLSVSIADVDLRESVIETIEIPVGRAPGELTAAAGQVVVTSGTAIRATPDASAEVVARIEGGHLSLPRTGTSGDFIGVRLTDHQTGWISQSAASSAAAADPAAELQWEVSHMPPRLEIDHGSALVTRADSVRISGEATDDQQVRDIYIYAGSRKVFYLSNAPSATPRSRRFEAEIPLRAGVNYISVFARESDDVTSRRTFVVRRDGPDGSLLETPARSDNLFGFDHGE